MKALTDEESDAMEMRFPVLRPRHAQDGILLRRRPARRRTRPASRSPCPPERRVNQTRLEVRYSPTLAGAMVDALPYLVDYPYGCTEQTLNRFLPTVITQRMLQSMKLDLKEIQKQRTNLNAQEIGNDKERAKRLEALRTRNPVFDEDEVTNMTEAGVQALQSMQCSDGGWGWFSGYGEHSWPHTTAVVVHGLQIAKAERRRPAGQHAGTRRRLAEELPGRAGQCDLNNAPTKTDPVEGTRRQPRCAGLHGPASTPASSNDDDARVPLPRPHRHLAVYAKAMFGLALHKEQQAEKLAMILKNIEQFVVQDDENQTAYLKLPGRQSLVVLVRQRDRGQRLLPQAAVARPTPRTRRRRGWSSTCSTTASTPPTGTARATPPCASRPWPSTSRPAARTGPT